MAQNKEFHYQQGERILCYHGPMIYEAKVMYTQIKIVIIIIQLR